MAKLSDQATSFITQACGLSGSFPAIIAQLSLLNDQALTADLSDNDHSYTLLTLAIALKSAKYGQLQQSLGDKSP